MRYLRGDETLAAEVAENRFAQKRLAVEAPDHPAPLFGEAAENGEVLPKSAVMQIHAAIDGLRADLQQTHVWSFNRELGRERIVVGGSELEWLDQDERVVRVGDLLKERYGSGRLEKVWQQVQEPLLPRAQKSQAGPMPPRQTKALSPSTRASAVWSTQKRTMR